MLGKREENKSKKIQALCDAGLALYLERGIANVTVDEIVGRAGVAKGSFYRFFDNQEALVLAVLTPLRDAVAEAIMQGVSNLSGGVDRETLQPQWLSLAAQVATAVFAHQDVARLYLQESRGPAVDNRRPIAALAKQLHQGALLLSQVAQQHGLSRADYHANVSAHIVVGAVEHLLAAFLGGADLGPPERIPSTLIETILDGVRPKGS